MTVLKGTPRLVCACGSKKISARTTPSAAARRRYAMARSWKSCSVTSASIAG